MDDVDADEEPNVFDAKE